MITKEKEDGYLPIVGIDPSVSHLGIVAGYMKRSSLDFIPIHWDVISPTAEGEQYGGKEVKYDKFAKYFKNNEKRKNVEDSEKEINLSRQLVDFFELLRKNGFSPSVVVYEVPKGGKGGYATDSLYTAMGQISGFLGGFFGKGLEVFPLTAYEVKRGASRGLVHDLPKEGVIHWAVLNQRTIDWKVGTVKFEERLKNEAFICPEASNFNEHVADSLASIEALKYIRWFEDWIKENEDRFVDKVAESFKKHVERWNKVRDVFEVDLKSVLDGYGKEQTWAYQKFEPKYPFRTCEPVRYEGHREWDDLLDSKVALLRRWGYTGTAIRKEIYRCSGSIKCLFTDTSLMTYIKNKSLVWEMALKEYTERKKKVKDPKLPQELKEDHPFVDFLKKIEWYEEYIDKDLVRHSTISQIFSIKDEKMQLEECNRKIALLKFRIGQINYQLRNRDDYLKFGYFNEFNTKLAYYCYSVLVDSFAGELKKLNALRNKLNDKKKKLKAEK